MSAAEPAPTGLVPVARRPTFSAYLRELWSARQLAYTLAHNDHRSEHRSMLLGDLWHLLNPALQVAVYALVFGGLLPSQRPVDLVAFITIGVLLYGFIQRGVTEGSMALVQSSALIREVAFPRAALPLASVLQAALEFRWQLVILLSVVTWSHGGPDAGWVLFLLVVLPATGLLTFGAALVWARLTSQVRDLSGVLQVGFRIMLFASGVMFPLEGFLDPDRARLLESVNPFAAVLSLARHLLLEPVPHGARLVAIVLGWSVAAMLIGTLYFLRAEQDYGNR